MVALVNENNVENFIQFLKVNFYETLPNARDCDLNQMVFATQPGAGASIFSF